MLVAFGFAIVAFIGQLAYTATVLRDHHRGPGRFPRRSWSTVRRGQGVLDRDRWGRSMSDLTAAAAAALGIPEAIVDAIRRGSGRRDRDERGRSAERLGRRWRRWACRRRHRRHGGRGVPRSRRHPPIEPAESAPAVAAPTSRVIESAGGNGAVIAPRIQQPPSGSRRYSLSGPDQPIAVARRGLGLFVAVFLVGLCRSFVPTENPGARSSDLPYTEAGPASAGISMPIGRLWVLPHADGASGRVRCRSRGGSAQRHPTRCSVARRFGPDLSDIERADARAAKSRRSYLGLGDHPGPVALIGDDLDDLVALHRSSR